jgi:ribosomal protein S18 acetylase RimI-like enzyme
MSEIDIKQLFAIAGYRLRCGSPLDRAAVVTFMERTYADVEATLPRGQIAATVDRYLSRETPLWWVDTEADPPLPVGVIWLGQATDQRNGLLHPYLLMLYVAPAHRRRGIARALLAVVQNWAVGQGYRQISLQVFSQNRPAQALYASLGYQSEAVLMKKDLPPGPPGGIA